jgi:hypothetical protein
VEPAKNKGRWESQSDPMTQRGPHRVGCAREVNVCHGLDGVDVTVVGPYWPPIDRSQKNNGKSKHVEIMKDSPCASGDLNLIR